MSVSITQLTVNSRYAARALVLEVLALAAILVIAAGLRVANLTALGDANHYYAAAVQAMMQSWHNFFFAAAEPGGSVSVDKPPVGLWFQVVSAYIFGVNSWGLLLPQIIAGICSVILVYYLVRRSFGGGAGLIAALALALTPIVVATDRNNTMDSTLVLTLLLATWAFVAATERGQARYVILGMILVGIGFNIKMLQAYLPLPAFVALYFLGSREHWWRKIFNLGIAGVVLLVVSLTWALIVDFTPESQRPYVGSSGDNSELTLIVGYNGLNRLVGMGRGGAPGGQPQISRQDDNTRPQFQDDGRPQFQDDGNGAPPPLAFNGNPRPGAPGNPDPGGGGFPGTGQPGAMRLFANPLSKETSWLLVFGLFSGVLLIFRARPGWTIAPKHQALVLWGGWLMTSVVFFSIAGFFHEYYLAMLGAPLAALVGIGMMELWRIRARHPWIALGLTLVATGATLVMQYVTAKSFIGTMAWLPLVIGLYAGGIALLIPWRPRMERSAMIGLMFVIAALLVTPGIWSWLTVFNSSGNQSLPSAYDGRTTGPANRGGVQVNQQMLAYLQTNTQNMKYLLAVPSSMQGADYVLATGRPVLYLGGFNGNDRVVSTSDLQKMVANHELRFIYYDAHGGGGPGAMRSDISSWVSSACKPVGYDAATQNFGAPDGTAGNANNNIAAPFGQSGPGMQITLYDCGK